MINKRLLGLLKENIKYIKLTLIYQWAALIMNIIFIFCIATILALVNNQDIRILWLVVIAIAAIIMRGLLQSKATMSSYHASKDVKKSLREMIYLKILQLGNRYQETMSSAQVIQVANDGVEQLEIYFGKYLPQLFYSLIAPLTLFLLLMFINLKVAIVLIVCVPLIPISIVVIQKFAKKIVAKYWGSYTELADSFLENLQGLTTLKIYQADERKAKQMDREAENFRKVTMRVLIMQLNSISIMDLVAFGGAAIGIVVAILEFKEGNIEFVGLIAVLLLSAEFFIPLRLLGSFFHIAMNSMAASDTIFKLLDIDTPDTTSFDIDKENLDMQLSNVDFAYEEDRNILHNITIEIPKCHFIAFVGESGSGKSTLASILSGYQRQYSGSICIGKLELRDISESSLMDTITVVNHDGYLFAETVAYNLRLAKSDASDQELWNVLELVNLDQFIKENGGLSMQLLEQANNLSGGQKQRLVLARALLKDTPIYIFDEATSNIDVESEYTIMNVIYQLKKKKTVILISHRLENVIQADYIYMIESGSIVEEGTHDYLYQNNGAYATIYKMQENLMKITKGN